MSTASLPTLDDLHRERITCGDLAAALYPGQTYDCALPQAWVDRFNDRYYLATGGACLTLAFVWLYPQGSIFGQPAPLYREAAAWLTTLNTEEKTNG